MFPAATCVVRLSLEQALADARDDAELTARASALARFDSMSAEAQGAASSDSEAAREAFVQSAVARARSAARVPCGQVSRSL